MLVEVRVPVLAESVAEATLMDWHKQPGDPVKFGDALIDVETDKVTLEVVAPEDGMLVKILKNSGEDVLSNELIAEIDTDSQAAAAAPEPDTEVAPIETEPEQEPEAAAESAAKTTQTETEPADDAQQPLKSESGPKLSPAVRKLLSEHGLDAGDIPASGNRLTKKQVLDYLAGTEDKDRKTGDKGQGAGSEKQETDGKQQDAAAVMKPAPKPVEQAGGAESEGAGNRVPMTRLRRRAAERLLAAQRENAILTTFNEVNMKPVMDLRNRYKDNFEKTHKVKLGFMSFFTKAAVEALKKFPIINASVDGADIIYHDNFDIGIAVSSPRGLVVPVVRSADILSFAEIEKTISEYGQKAHDAKLTIEELTGGTFTITNGGVFGSLLSTPIINPPQRAILGMHKIEERPVAEDGAGVVRPMMYLALSYDHRIIDGREAVSFLVAIKEALEDPSRLLLQI
ncbi:MAG: 2-oxoglutarate dehydrogenase complex dihydrolipoyllysine-residue succinyltransferase [Gammaproteobacteria bacterium]|nr:2-oxoglutarate dehydrogenase complex dihydrolipoyllysine-residue succinyltransferase [Gammaproteobacteria bacterium]